MWWTILNWVRTIRKSSTKCCVRRSEENHRQQTVRSGFHQEEWRKGWPRHTTRHSEVEDLIETREERGSSCQLGPKEPVENDDVKNCVFISLPSFSINSTEPSFSKFAPNIYFVSTFISSRNRYETSWKSTPILARKPQKISFNFIQKDVRTFLVKFMQMLSEKYEIQAFYL